MEPRYYVSKATIIRTRACVADACSPVATRTFFPFELGADTYALPVVSLVTDSLHLFDHETGIYVPGVNYMPGDEATLQGDDGNVRFNNISLSGYPATSSSGEDHGTPNGLPGAPYLENNYPNPFNAMTRITYALPAEYGVTLAVYDLLGQRVSTLVDGEPRHAGTHTVTFHAGALPSGVYLVRLQANGQTAVRKITLIK